jgi:effector-binding domain-containing protein
VISISVNTMPELVTIIEEPSRLVATIRRRGPYSIIPALIGETCAFAVSSGAGITGPPFLMLHETSVEAAMEAAQKGTADVQVAVPIGRKVPGKGDTIVTTLPGGKMAKIVHRGPYEDSAGTYHRLFAWFEERGLHVAGPIREVYLNDPRGVRPEEILTEIYAPLE